MSSIEIFENLKRRVVRGEKVVAIFDLDSTIFDVSPRIAKILNDFGSLEKFKTTYPKECTILTEIKPDSGDYGVRKTLERYQFPVKDMDLIHAIVDFWKREFFSSRYLSFDKPYPGVLEYIQELHELGIEIYYLSGRDKPRMESGTVESLVRYGFPLKHQNLILKPSTDVSDVEFKRHFFASYETRIVHTIFFENEPANIHVALSAAPYVEVVFVDTVHAEKTPSLPSIIARITSWMK